jgi:hypothetical protein
MRTPEATENATIGRPASPGPETLMAPGLEKPLLACGIASSAYYAALNLFVPTRWPGYSSMSQVVSELSAIGAPTRELWLALCVPYSLMLIAFGVGVWMSGERNPPIRWVGRLLIAQAVIGAYWPPMHGRGVTPTLTDTLHIAWAGVWLLSMLAAMALAAAGMGRRFRMYTGATVAAFVAFGALTSIEAARLTANLPTPHIGLWERINMGVGMLWIAVLAGLLLRRRSTQPDSVGTRVSPPATRSPQGREVVGELEVLAERLDQIASRRCLDLGPGSSDARALAAAARNIRAIPKALHAGIHAGFAVGRAYGHREVELTQRAIETRSYSDILARQAWGGGQPGNA